MKILIVDDDLSKSKAISAAFEEVPGRGEQWSISTVATLGDAVRVISVVAFDLIVLDLMLPYLDGGAADSRAGLELLRQLRGKGGPNKATMVIGISSFPDEVAAFRADFNELGVLIVEFDDQEAWKRALTRVCEDVHTRTGPTQLDFLIVCALEEERSAFSRTAISKISETIVSGLNVHFVRLPGDPGLFGGIVRLSRMGLVAATFEAAIALRVFRTKILCMSGICAGLEKETSLGQIVVASPAWEYQAGKWSDNGFEIGPIQIPLRPATRPIIDQAISRDTFTQYLEGGLQVGETRPARQAGPILAPLATGSAVIADATRLSHIEVQHRKLAALDMETFGLYYVAHESAFAVEHYFSAKCIVDFADSKKEDDLHSYGCVVSARATEQLIRVLAG